MNKAIIRWNEEQDMWELFMQAAGEDRWTWQGWLIRNKLNNGKIKGGFVFDDILRKIAQLQENGYDVIIKA